MEYFGIRPIVFVFARFGGFRRSSVLVALLAPSSVRLNCALHDWRRSLIITTTPVAVERNCLRFRRTTA